MNNRNNKKAFTLIELLTVVVIISMMATFSLIAVNSSVNGAKESKTRGTIQKLDSAFQEIFEKYQDKYDNILNECVDSSGAVVTTTMLNTLNKEQLVELKQHLMYDLMRMEMPAHWFDVIQAVNTGTQVLPISMGTPDFYVKQPAVFDYYVQMSKTISNWDEGAAELLYLIVANLNPEALANFRGNEIGDVNGNGINEFHDGWGRPIQFIRFAPALTDTFRQPDIIRLSRGTSTPLSPESLDWSSDDPGWWTKPASCAEYNDMPPCYQRAITQMPDAFDPDNRLQRSWFLYPVIVSAGADGKFDIDLGRKNAGSILSPSQGHVNPFDYPTGMPRDNDGNGVLNHYDNISNHQQ